ncbi:helix-turn-helix transcriptional regulator [Microbacterium oleivorans]|uniref:helix-turn-helix transcriptional regulator n=1 Tax=Microbacterium oleivorans TaxID=273677 RepID=UPI00080E2453|nr:helix-turn-helix transcriptional regulator [Microbacterium oleivorans]
MQNTLPALRQDRGWSQQRLADELGVSRQTIISIERGRFDPSLPLAFRIARLFETSIEHVFEPDDAE